MLSKKKKKILSLTKELEDFSKIKLTCYVCASFNNENAFLNKKVLDLSKIVHQFINGKKFFLILGGQRCVFDKKGVRYKYFLKTIYVKNYFVKASSSNDSKYVCNYCNQNGHTSFSCPVKKNAYFSVKQVYEYQKFQRLTYKDPKLCWY